MEGPLYPAPPRRDVPVPVVSMGVGARKSKYHQIKYFFPQGEMLFKLQTLILTLFHSRRVALTVECNQDLAEEFLGSWHEGLYNISFKSI